MEQTFPCSKSSSTEGYFLFSLHASFLLVMYDNDSNTRAAGLLPYIQRLFFYNSQPVADMVLTLSVTAMQVS